MRALFINILSGIIALTGFASAQSLPDARVSCTSEPIHVSRLTWAEDGGWPLDFIDRTAVLNRTAPDRSGIAVVNYATQGRILTLPLIVVDPCSKSATLSNLYLHPDTVFAYEVKGRTFAYLVRSTPVSSDKPGYKYTGADMYVVLLDLHGKGQFEVAQIAAPAGPPPVPAWAR